MKRKSPLEKETRRMVETDVAATYLGRTPQTLRLWSCKGNGPLEPKKVLGRLWWKMADIRKIMREVQ